MASPGHQRRTKSPVSEGATKSGVRARRRTRVGTRRWRPKDVYGLLNVHGHGHVHVHG